MIVDIIDRKLDKLKSSLVNLIRRGELALVSASFFGQLSAGDGEQYDDIELWQQYGFASRPPADSEALVANLGGIGDNAIAFSSQNRDHRPTDLDADEVVTYGPLVAAGQAQVRHGTDGTLDLVCATGKTVNVGGDTDALIKGTTFKAALNTYVAAINTFATLIPGIAPLPPDPASPVVILAAAGSTFVNAAWLATYGKVS